MLVSATGPESSSSAPPLAFSTLAFAVSVNAATSPPRSPVSLKSCNVIPPAAARDAARNSRARRMDRGELLLMDVGAECAGYAADITRTIPVGAPFSKRQREIYEIVLGAQNAVIAAIKPGLPFGDLGNMGREYIDTHGKDPHAEP